MPDTAKHRKSRGAFFTPPEITRFIVEWAITRADASVLEPSCGEAAFLLAAGERVKALGDGLFAGSKFHGIELHEASAQTAKQRLHDAGIQATIENRDFFGTDAEPTFDAVIGNPPFVRYQNFSGAARRKAQEAALRQGVRLSGLASSWAAFAVHAAGFVGAHGRLGLVLPAELMGVKYAADVRQFLLERFGNIRLVTFEDLVFPEVQEEVIILLAEGQGPTSHFSVYQAANLSDLQGLKEEGWSDFRGTNKRKWTSALVNEDRFDAYEEWRRSDNFHELLRWGETYLGVVTGNNKFFALSQEQVSGLGLEEGELVRISPPGSKHLHGLSFAREHWETLVSDGAAGWLFRPEAPLRSEASREYVAAGETVDVHEAYKCRVRDPWWQVPLVRVPDLFLTYMDRDQPRMLANEAHVLHLNSVYGISLRTGLKELGKDVLPTAFLNSVTLLGAELTGRAYGGGLLKLEPNEADLLPVPAVDLLQQAAPDLRDHKSAIDALLRRREYEQAVKRVDEILLLGAAGMSKAHLAAVTRARDNLQGRRLARGKRNNGSH